MKEISSRANPLWRDWMHQRAVAGRVGNLIWLEGEHLCQAWLTKREQPLWAVFDQDKVTQPALNALRQRIDPDRQVLLASGLFAQLSTVKAAQGILFLVNHAQANPISTDDQQQFQFDMAILLDGVQDPGNLGTLLRLSAAVGVTHVCLGSGCAAAWSPKVLRSAQGAHFALNLIETESLVRWLQHYRQVTPEPVKVIVTAFTCAKPLRQTVLPSRSIWVFGHEGQGVSPELLTMADLKVRIEHDQTVVDSLNVASSAAICLFEQSRQHHTTEQHSE